MIYWLYVATELGQFFLHEAYTAENVRVLVVCSRFLSAIAAVQRKSIRRSDLPALKARVNASLAAIDAVFPQSHQTIVHHLFSHVTEQIERTGPLFTGWTLFGERYGRFLKNLANMANRSTTSLVNAWSQWHLLNPIKAYPMTLEVPSYLNMNTVDVQPLGRSWKRITLTEDERTRFFTAIDQKEEEGGVFEYGTRLRLNNLAVFKTEAACKRFKAQNCYCFINFDDNTVYVAAIQRLLRWTSVARSPPKYVFDVLVKHTSSHTNSDTGHTFTKVDLSRAANMGARHGEFYNVCHVGLANPILAPVWNRYGLPIANKYTVLNPDQFDDVDDES